MSVEPVRLDEDVDVVEPQAPEGFTVHDAQTANWVVRKIVEARRYSHRVEAWAAGEIRRAENEERYFLQRFGPQLQQWARQQLVAQGDRRKSIHLPAGTVGFRLQPLHLEIRDEPALLDWCKKHLPEAITVVERVLKTVVSQHVEQTGECPDGADLVGAGERFAIK